MPRVIGSKNIHGNCFLHSSRFFLFGLLQKLVGLWSYLIFVSTVTVSVTVTVTVTVSTVTARITGLIMKYGVQPQSMQFCARG